MLDAHRLRVLRSVVSTGSVSGAATLLGYTPSAVSQHLSALSRETGLTLVDRVGRGIEPTAAGRTLASASDLVLGALSGVQDVVDDLRAGRSGTLVMRYFASVGAAWMPRVVAALQEEFPDVRLVLQHAELAPAADTPAADLDVSVARLHPFPPLGHTAHTLLEDPYLLVVPAGHPLAGRDRVAMAELADESWVDNDIPGAPCRSLAIDAAAACGFSPRFTVDTHDFHTALAFVGHGLGITVMPELACRQLPGDVVAMPLVDPTPVREIRVLVRDTVAGAPAARRAVELLRDCAAS
ncbi:LysR family transcriptional regulator [Ornithinimicrobium faecis]|uniref:LysR family transcriptional regulator n=1 Tax=Ornithinimicrobium faecis TaxID=2934158 RepID=A0ABY4YVN6_9MICO|nr:MULTISPECIES: LysR family transcriptional regulator [unclassified Ornithinimicrobium]USQ80691.1 LysR family transcriptional regulator [Ornithinimicrobium sp. HY1793]